MSTIYILVWIGYVFYSVIIFHFIKLFWPTHYQSSHHHFQVIQLNLFIKMIKLIITFKTFLSGFVMIRLLSFYVMTFHVTNFQSVEIVITKKSFASLGFLIFFSNFYFRLNKVRCFLKILIKFSKVFLLTSNLNYLTYQQIL